MNEQLRLLYGYLYGMWRYRWSALFITWVAVILGWVVVLALPDIYEVKAVVYIDTTSVMTPLLKGLATESDSKDELAVMTRVLLSRKNLLDLIKDTDMDLEVNTPAEKEMMLVDLRQDITIKGGVGQRGKDNNIYELSYNNKNSKQAYQVVSGLLNTMIENTLSSGRTDSVTAQKFMDSQISEYEERLFFAEQKLAEFKKENFGFMPDERGSYYSRLQSAKSEIEVIKSRLKLGRKRYAKLEKQLSGETPLLNSQMFEGGVTKLQRLEERLKTLLISYTEKHPDVQALMASIEHEKNIVTPSSPAASADGNDAVVAFNPVYQELKVGANKAAVELDMLKSELEYRQRAVEKLTGYIDIIPEVEAKLTRLNRDYTITKRRYLNLVDRREASRLAESASKSSSDITFRVIEQPIVPITPSGPPRMLYLVAALFAALGAGLAWGFVRFMLAPTFLDVRQLSEKTGLPTLGAVSLYVSPQHKAQRRVQLFSFLAATSLLVVAFSSTILFHEQGVVLVNSLVSVLKKV